MLHTFETRLSVDPELDALLASNAAHWSWGLRKAWALLYRQRLAKPAAYASLCKLGFTSHQVGSLLTSAEMRHAGLVELKKYEAQQRELAVFKRERALAAKRKKIASLTKRQAALRKNRNTWAPKPGKERTKRYLGALAKLRAVETELAFCRNWVAQKERALHAKRGKLASLSTTMAAGHYALCFGSRRLLSQRPTEHNLDTTPFDSLDAWRNNWAEAREGQWWSIGTAKKPQGNAEVQWCPESRQLRLRLTDELAHRRMDERGVPRSGGPQSAMPLRMQCRFITLDDVDFVGHKGAARAALENAFGKQPVTMRVLWRAQKDGSRAWYLQASLDLATGFDQVPARGREAGVMGLDFNARGVAWCVVRPDGNRAKGEHGFMPWTLKGLPANEQRQAIGETVAQLARHAKRLQLAVAIESLDFATKKASARAGAVNKRYNDMLGALPSAQFAELTLRVCEKDNLRLYAVNPAYSSVGGFTKYGRPNRMNADTSAALWLGRQALYGEVYKTEGAQNLVQKFNERLSFSHLPATLMRSMTALVGVQWRDVARGLGSNRSQWGSKLRRWGELQVETASRSKEPPGLALPAG